MSKNIQDRPDSDVVKSLTTKRIFFAKPATKPTKSKSALIKSSALTKVTDASTYDKSNQGKSNKIEHDREEELKTIHLAGLKLKILKTGTFSLKKTDKNNHDDNDDGDDDDDGGDDVEIGITSLSKIHHTSDDKNNTRDMSVCMETFSIESNEENVPLLYGVSDTDGTVCELDTLPDGTKDDVARGQKISLVSTLQNGCKFYIDLIIVTKAGKAGTDNDKLDLSEGDFKFNLRMNWSDETTYDPNMSFIDVTFEVITENGISLAADDFYHIVGKKLMFHVPPDYLALNEESKFMEFKVMPEEYPKLASLKPGEDGRKKQVFTLRFVNTPMIFYDPHVPAPFLRNDCTQKEFHCLEGSFDIPLDQLMNAVTATIGSFISSPSSIIDSISNDLKFSLGKIKSVTKKGGCLLPDKEKLNTIVGYRSINIDKEGKFILVEKKGIKYELEVYCIEAFHPVAIKEIQRLGNNFPKLRKYYHYHFLNEQSSDTDHVTILQKEIDDYYQEEIKLESQEQARIKRLNQQNIADDINKAATIRRQDKVISRLQKKIEHDKNQAATIQKLTFFIIATLGAILAVISYNIDLSYSPPKGQPKNILDHIVDSIRGVISRLSKNGQP